MKNQIKPKFAFVSLSSCGGCLFTILQGGEKFFDFLNAVDLKNFDLLKDEVRQKSSKGKFLYDVCVIEGIVVNESDLEKLKFYRENSKILISLGLCAMYKGVSRLKNNNEVKIKSISECVKVDVFIPGCPPDFEETLRVLNSAREGVLLKTTKNPVCYECQKNEYECLLQKGEPCLGPVTRGGCSAICIKNKYACDGCRGFLKDASTNNLEKALSKTISEDRLKELYKRFGNSKIK